MSFVETEPQPRAEPRWPAFLGVLAIGVLWLALPEALTLGPNWLLLLVVGALAVPALVLHRLDRHGVDKVLGFCESAAVTFALGWSLWALIRGLPSHREPAVVLLRSAAALWLSNVLVFASWYWRLDGGGPHKRSQRHRHVEGAFLFPQMTLQSERNWVPGFVDYLFPQESTPAAIGSEGARYPVAPETKGGRNGELETNQLTIIGFTGNDAEAHYTPSGTLVTTILVATKESWKNADGQWQSRTEWHRVVSFGKLAEYARTLGKGSHVTMQRPVRSREYERDGVKHGVFELRADTIAKLDRAERRQDTDIDSDVNGG